MGRLIDLAGQRFDRWTVLANAPPQGERVMWRCRCVCGTEKAVQAEALRYGRSRSCGCLQRELASRHGKANLQNLAGRRFGRWLVLSQAPSLKGVTYWLCRCDCGTERPVPAGKLVSKGTKSCGCLRKEWGPNHHNWKGGRRKSPHGYIEIWTRGKHAMEHRIVMERFLGRKLSQAETVHHKNGVRDDNRLENLELWVSSQPPGQRVADRVADAIETLMKYAPAMLSSLANMEIE